MKTSILLLFYFLLSTTSYSVPPSVELYSFGNSDLLTADPLLHTSQTEPHTVSSPTSETVQVAPPRFSHEGGPYTEPFQLLLTGDDETEIYYTLNNTIPSPQNGQRYTIPVRITGSLILRAVAFRNGESSEIVSQVYTRLSPEVAQFTSNLPLIIVHSYNQQITSGDRVPAAITLTEDGEGGRYSFQPGNTIQNRMEINKRGSSSLMFPKNMFGLTLRDEEDQNRNLPLLGMPSENNWILYAPYTDMTLMRNVVAYRLSEKMGWYSPRTEFAELFFHTGSGQVTMQHYHGVYVLVERIKWDNNRVDITKIQPEDNSEPEITGGYIIKKDRLNEGESGFRTRRGTQLAHVRPHEHDMTSQQREWIRNYMSDFEEALFGNRFRDPDAGYEKYIDTDSFIDHFLHTELLKEIDGFRLSTFMYKDREGKLIMGPVWDYNLSLGIGNYLEGWIPRGWYHEIMVNDCFIGCNIREWYLRLMEDPDYMDRLRKRWWELRNGIFSNEYLLGMIDDNRELLQESQARDFQRWPRLGTYVWPNWFIGNTWMEEVNWMKNWLSERLAWMDTQLGPKPENRLHYFWAFTDELPNNTPLETIDATYSQTGQQASIRYHSSLDGYPFDNSHPDWRRASMERRNRPTALNYRTIGNEGRAYTEERMRGLQIRQPFQGSGGETELLFHLPSENLSDLLFSFAVMNEDAAEQLRIDYSTDPDGPVWTTSGLNLNTPDLTDEYRLWQIDFSSVPEVNDNPDFKIRIRFGSDNPSADEGNRVTFNNISLEASMETDPGDLDPDESDGPFQIYQNYPNPFLQETTIPFRLSVGTRVKVELYDLLGRHVATLLDENRDAGMHRIPFDGSTLPSGLYLYRIQTSFYTGSKQMVRIK